MRNISLSQLLWYLIGGTRGGMTRAKIINAIRKEPMNLNQLSKRLNLDYKTIKHHIKILVKHNIFIVFNKDSYGAVYFISEELKENIQIFEEIWDRIGK